MKRDSSPLPAFGKRARVVEQDIEEIPDNFFDVNFTNDENFNDSNITVPDNFFDVNFTNDENVNDSNVTVPDNFFDVNFTNNEEYIESNTIPDNFFDMDMNNDENVTNSNVDVPENFEGNFTEDRVNVGAGTSTANDGYWTYLDTSDDPNIDSAIVLIPKNRKTNKKYNAEEFTYQALIDTDNLPQFARGHVLQKITEVVYKLFERLLNIAKTNLEEADLIRICIVNSCLDKPISTHLMKVSEMTVEKIMSCILRVLQSKESIKLDEAFTADVIAIKRPTGAGRRKLIIPDVDRLCKKSIVTISEEDGLCCAKAILLAIAYIENHPELNALRKQRNTLLLRKAMALHSSAGVREGPCGIPEIAIFERYLDVQVVIICSEALNTVIYKGSHRSRKIYLWLRGNHYDIIRSPKGFYGSKNYCESCEKPFEHYENHCCTNMCHICRSAECTTSNTRRCNECDRLCRSLTCYTLHKERGICDHIYQCRICCKVIQRKLCPKENHRCNETQCPNCKKFVLANHRCFLKKIEAKNANNNLIFFDFETDQSTGEHCVNYAVLQYADATEKIFDGYDALDKFCRYLFTHHHKGFTVIAHNMKGFDGQFILRWMIEQGQTPDVIPCGSKLMSIHLAPLKLRIIDSFNFFPMALARLPKTFGLDELQKGYFPHLFNRPENQGYIGDLPASGFYSTDTMSVTEREKFLKWYEERKSYSFNFKEEMLLYCRSDVDILRRSCLEFRSQFMTETGVDPFCYVTIAAACMATYRSTHIPENCIGMIPRGGYINKTANSRDGIRWLDYVAAKEGINIKHALNGVGEQKIGQYSVDGFCSETNTVYQFHGCFFHGCNKCFDADTVNPLTGTTMAALHQKTNEISAEIHHSGYELKEMWEHNFKCMKETNEDLKTFLISHDVVDRLNPRDAFYGGRTNAVQLYYEGSAKYIDFTSLYPWVNKYCKYPIGHPDIITEGFGNIEQYFGLIKCRVQPPRDLYHPVLPYRCRGKLMFPLCRTCVENNIKECFHTGNQRAFTGTWVTEEVKKAQNMGYIIEKIYEVYNFKSSSSDLFKSYIDLFLKIKQEASGWPPECSTDELKQKYIDSYWEKEGIQLDINKIAFNPGRRSVAKLALNSFWGRWGMNCNKDKLNFLTSVPQFNKLLIDKTKNIKDVFLASPEVAAVVWSQEDDFNFDDIGTNIFIAAFTTCHARLKLYSELEKLNRSVLYFDTDSIIYKTEGIISPPLGNFLGEFTDELNGDTIKTFVSGGPKNYAFKTYRGETYCKVRGFTLNFKNSLLLNFESIKDMVCNLNESSITITADRKITRNSKTRNVTNKYEQKLYKIVYEKRVIQPDMSTLPYGY